MILSEFEKNSNKLEKVLFKLLQLYQLKEFIYQTLLSLLPIGLMSRVFMANN